MGAMTGVVVAFTGGLRVADGREEVEVDIGLTSVVVAVLRVVAMEFKA